MVRSFPSKVLRLPIGRRNQDKLISTSRDVPCEALSQAGEACPRHSDQHRKISVHLNDNMLSEKIKTRNPQSVFASILTDKATAKGLVYTGLRGDLEHLTIETRLIGKSFECVMGECVI